MQAGTWLANYANLLSVNNQYGILRINQVNLDFHPICPGHIVILPLLSSHFVGTFSDMFHYFREDAGAIPKATFVTLCGLGGLIVGYKGETIFTN